MAKSRFQNRDVEEKDKIKMTKERLIVLKWLFSYIKPHFLLFSVGLIFLILSSLTILCFPYLTGKLVDLSMGKTDVYFSKIQDVIIVLMVVLLFQAVFSFLRVYIFAHFTEKIIAQIRSSLFSKLLFLPIPFFENRRVGELSSRVNADISQLHDVFSITFAEFLRQISVLLVGVGILFFISAKLTFFMLATFPFLILIAVFFGKSIRKLSKNTQDELAKSSVIVEEILQSIQIVKIFTNEKFEIKRYNHSLENLKNMAIKSSGLRGLFISLIIFVLFGGIVMILWYGATLVSNGQISIGDMTSFVIYTSIIGASVGGLGDMYGQLQKTVGASERIVEIFKEIPEYDFDNHQLTKKKYQGNIKFSNVDFAYPSRVDVKVLRSINFEIKPNNKIAIVGKSGAGKTTITQLLLKFYKIQQGDILIDDTPINQLNTSELRENIGIVPQEILLFGGTIKENIAYGNPQASDEEIIQAAQKAHALEFIHSFPENWDTIVGERGIKLSGGQKQRIAIARAILKNPPILILDEATSSLDAASEQLVQMALDELMKNRTTIIIAHRLSTIQNVDNILVLHNGSIVEQGNHNELSKIDNGYYQNLLKIQTNHQSESI